MLSITYRDITDRRRIEQALEEVRVAAELANRAKSDFVARMSHEERTRDTRHRRTGPVAVEDGADARAA